MHVPDAAAKFTCEGVYHGAAAAAAAAVTSGPTHTVSECTLVKMNDIVETKVSRTESRLTGSSRVNACRRLAVLSRRTR